MALPSRSVRAAGPFPSSRSAKDIAKLAERLMLILARRASRDEREVEIRKEGAALDGLVRALGQAMQRERAVLEEPHLRYLEPLSAASLRNVVEPYPRSGRSRSIA